MDWTWSKIDEIGLARFVIREAIRYLPLPCNPNDLLAEKNGPLTLLECIYRALLEKHIRYAHEIYSPENESQLIRSPSEILEGPRQGTCLDLAILFCGLCLGYGLLPCIIVIEGHALAAISIMHRLQDWNGMFSQRSVFDEVLLKSPEHLLRLIERNEYIVIECTGFAHSEALPQSSIEGGGRTDGYLSFDQATEAGKKQLEGQRTFRFALDIAKAHLGHGIGPHHTSESPDPHFEAIYRTFHQHTGRTLLKSEPLIKGLPETIYRDELETIQEQLKMGQSVLMVGESGTGKSGISHILAKKKQASGCFVMAIDARELRSVNNENQLRRYYSLTDYSVFAACELIGRQTPSRSDLDSGDRSAPFLLLIDQLDNVAGTSTAAELVQLAIECSKSELIQVVVFSRRRETMETDALQELKLKNGFIEFQCREILDAVPYLKVLGIQSPSKKIAELARNLFNLSIIAEIRYRKPDWNPDEVSNDIDLWDFYFKTLVHQESNYPGIASEMARLAKEAVENEKSTFVLPDPISAEHRRLLSWNVIKRSGEGTRVCTFAHENMHNFLYARDAIEQGKTVEQVEQELPDQRHRGITPLMQELRKTYGPPAERREELRSFFS